MKRARYTAEQKAFALRQTEAGVPISEILRKMGISEATFYRWKKAYGGMGVAEIRRLYVLLRREGWQVNHKRIYRLYRYSPWVRLLAGRAGISHGLPYSGTEICYNFATVARHQKT